jgi:hypothetical protein
MLRTGRALIALLSPLVALGQYHFATFEVPGATQTIPQAINDSGDIAGYTVQRANVHGFVRRSNGALSTFELPNCCVDGLLSAAALRSMARSISSSEAVEASSERIESARRHT